MPNPRTPPPATPERPRPKQDDDIDEAVEESFPASDPPSWTPSEALPNGTDREDEEPERKP